MTPSPAEMQKMTISKDQLITAIHQVEKGNHTRISSLITECYLMRQFKISFAQGKYSDVQSGWVILRNPSLHHGEETWYRLISSNTPVSTVDMELMNKFARPGRRFFSVSYKFSSDFSLPKSLILSAQEMGTDRLSLSSDRQEQSNILMDRLNLFFSRVNKTKSSLTKPFAPWLQNLDQHELEFALAQRCLMNAIGICLDIDAIALRSADNKLVLFEFKRKYPTVGGNALNEAFDKNFNNLDRITSTLTCGMSISHNKIKNEDYDLRHPKLCKTFEQICKDNLVGGYRKNPDAKYCGLDRDHVHNVSMCEKAHVEYRYLVWNYKPANDPSMVKLPKKTQHSEIKILERLLSPNLQAIQGNRNFLAATLTCKNAAAFSFTEGADSGIFNDGIRVQVLFSMPEVKTDHFSPVTTQTLPR